MPAYSPGFRSLDTEHDGLALDVDGDIPAWLSGSLVRNGPGKFEAGGQRVEHWFDGLAMLHKFRFDEGRGGVTYSNRLLRTEAYRKAVEEGTISGQFATSGSYLDQLRSFFDDPTDNANVNVARLGGEYVALTETPRRVRFDPESLSVTGDLTYDDDLTGHHVTAHLQHDDRRGETVGYMTEFGLRNRYHVYRVPDEPPEDNSEIERNGPERIPIASVEVNEPAYLHSFALTPRYAVIVEPPFVVNPFRFLLPGDGGFIDNYRWKPERGTRFLAFDRETGDLVAERRVPAFFFFHTVNAFEAEVGNSDGDGDEDEVEIVVDLVAYDDASIVEELFMSEVEGTDSGPALDAAEGELARFRVPVEGRGSVEGSGSVEKYGGVEKHGGVEKRGDGGVERRDLYTGIELPRVAPRVRMQSYGYVYGQATAREGQNGLVKVNVETGEATEWWAEGHYAGEPIFVSEPDGKSGSTPEDRGVVLAPVLDTEAEESLLVVLDGETFEERARAQVPHHIPFGFHGEFFPTVEE